MVNSLGISTSVVNGIFKFFLIFIIHSETQSDAVQKCILLVHSLKGKRRGDGISRIIQFMFFMHVFNVCIVLFLINLWVFSSYRLLDALNNSLAILMLNALHIMSTKIILKFIYSTNSRITNDSKYLKVEMKIINFENIHAVTTAPSLVFLSISAFLLWKDKEFIKFILKMTTTDFCAFLLILTIISAVMFTVIAYYAKPIVNIFSKSNSSDLNSNGIDSNDEVE